MSDINDWSKYYSKSQSTWCWESKSRSVRLLAASRSQTAVFEAGWVVLPADPRQGRSLPRFLNVFTGKQVSNRSQIPEFVTENPVVTLLGKRSRPNTQVVEQREDDQRKAAAHYNSLDRRGENRDFGSLARMRALNNWVKAVLIDMTMNSMATSASKKNQTTERSVSILELACGKGGDFFKIQNAAQSNGSRLRYVGVDIAQESLGEFVGRISEDDKRKRRQTKETDARLCHADIGGQYLTQCKDTEPFPTWDSTSKTWSKGSAFGSEDSFDLVTMQFALHYMCESPKRLKTFFTSWSANLKTGSCFIATTVDADVLRRHILEHPSTEEVLFKDDIGRVSGRVVLDSAARNSLEGKTWYTTLGIRYEMILTEYSADGKSCTTFVDAPEWVAPIDLIVRYAKEYGNLHLIQEESCNFHDFYHKKKGDENYYELLRKMKVPNTSKSFGNVEWTLANLYRTLVFRKGSGL